jgi:hypothetical protein
MTNIKMCLWNSNHLEFISSLSNEIIKNLVAWNITQEDSDDDEFY